MGDIMDKLARKRKVIEGNELCPDMTQRNIRLRMHQGKCEHSTAASTNAVVSTDNNDDGDEQGEETGEINVGNSMQIVPVSRDDVEQPQTSHALATLSTMSKATRRGPCHFGCTTTTNIRNGVQVWKATPQPSPWPNVGKNAALCNRCYCKGIALRNRLAAETSMRQSLEASDRKRKAQTTTNDNELPDGRKRQRTTDGQVLGDPRLYPHNAAGGIDIGTNADQRRPTPTNADQPSGRPPEGVGG